MNECIHGDRYKLEDMDERELQICMYRTYKGIIIISDYNSCNISYTIVDKYFPLFFFSFLSSVYAACERVSNINKISFHAHSRVRMNVY